MHRMWVKLAKHLMMQIISVSHSFEWSLEDLSKVITLTWRDISVALAKTPPILKVVTHNTRIANVEVFRNFSHTLTSLCLGLIYTMHLWFSWYPPLFCKWGVEVSWLWLWVNVLRFVPTYVTFTESFLYVRTVNNL